MEGLRIVPVASWSEVDRPGEVLGLVNQIQVGQPYNYRPGEITATGDWFPPLVDRSDLTVLAYAGTGRPVGYLVGLALTGDPDALTVAEHQGMHPPDTGYLAELAVSFAQRRHGIASMLLARVIEQQRCRGWLVQTLENNTAAIALYQRHGFALVPEVREVRYGRPRVFLVTP